MSGNRCWQHAGEQFGRSSATRPIRAPSGTFGGQFLAHPGRAVQPAGGTPDLAHFRTRAPPLINDLIGGQVSAAMVDATTASPHLKSGKFKVLAGGTQRQPRRARRADLPGTGYHSFDWYGWSVCSCRPARFAPVVAKASADTARGAQDARHRQPRFEGLSLPPPAGGIRCARWRRDARNFSRRSFATRRSRWTDHFNETMNQTCKPAPAPISPPNNLRHAQSLRRFVEERVVPDGETLGSQARLPRAVLQRDGLPGFPRHALRRGVRWRGPGHHGRTVILG